MDGRPRVRVRARAERFCLRDHVFVPFLFFLPRRVTENYLYAGWRFKIISFRVLRVGPIDEPA